ncbi:MAG TPA: hypothetical protein V6D06_17755, partial [Trichocoleus sp.]
MPKGTLVAATRWLQASRSALTLSLSVVVALVGTGLGTNVPSRADVVSVGYDSTDLPTLSEADQAKIDALQNVGLPLVLSDVSP